MPEHTSSNRTRRTRVPDVGAGRAFASARQAAGAPRGPSPRLAAVALLATAVLLTGCSADAAEDRAGAAAEGGLPAVATPEPDRPDDSERCRLIVTEQLRVKLRRNDGSGYPAELVSEVGEQSAEFRAYQEALPDFLQVGFRQGEDAAVAEVEARVRDACADAAPSAATASPAPLSDCAWLVVAALSEGTNGLDVVRLERGTDSFEYELFRSLLPQYLQDQQALGKDRALANYGNVAELSCASQQGPVPTDPDEAGI